MKSHSVQSWMKDLKKGDRVKVLCRKNRWGVVDKVLKTQVVLEAGDRFSTKTGRIIGEKTGETIYPADHYEQVID